MSRHISAPYMSILLSFIIPAYNAEPYLRECLDSIGRLTMRGHGYEVIVVDDGSTDGTAELLANYQKTHAEVVVLSQENRGLSAARNAGLRCAKGKYVCFVDADDHIYAAQPPVDVLGGQDIDIVGVNILQVDGAGKRMPYRRYVPPYNHLYVPARTFMQGRNLMPCAVAYFFRRAFLEQENVHFTEGIYHEDEDFTVRAFVQASSFMALNVDWYERLLHAESITTTTDVHKQQQKLRDLVKVLGRLDGMAQSDSEWGACMQYKLDYLAVDMLRLLLRQRHTRPFQKEIVGAMRELGYFPLRWHSEWKHILFNAYTRAILCNV
ncbi:MAG: glycosyltransferase [Bacteroidaceae bacterium]|nr:glycosyltransferase [Bacteroidaceae bacterium]